LVKLGKIRNLYHKKDIFISKQIKLILACPKMSKNVFSGIKSTPISEKSDFFS